MRLAEERAEQLWGAFRAGLVAAPISYVIVVSVVAALWAHQCGRFYFGMAFAMGVYVCWIFVFFGLIVGLATAVLATRYRIAFRRFWVATTVFAIVVFGVAYVSSEVLPFTPDFVSKPHTPGECAPM
jgi:hypothetical protein